MFKIRRRWVFRIGLALIILGIYPAWVLGYTWSRVYKAEFQGDRHGPLDAYRHALASGVLAYTFGEKTVEVFSHAMEFGGKRSNRMDIHNNLIGAKIGAGAKSFGEIEPLVKKAVQEGIIDSQDKARITWLPEEDWKSGKMW